ncbi:MAG TPA: hypothetical protein VFJ58_20885 [Armatimonadota bacterium]|nr:hypothetical protein [Armatimonadota bacterium]
MDPTPNGGGSSIDVAVSSLLGRLHLGNEAHPDNSLGAWMTPETMEPLTFRSAPGCSRALQDTFVFPLTTTEVGAIEESRHAVQGGRLCLSLSLKAVAASAHSATVPAGPLGAGTVLATYYQARVDPLRLQIERSAWVERVLPGLVNPGVCLLEVHVPGATPGAPSARELFDGARRKLEACDYTGCIGDCRDVRKRAEQHYCSGPQKKVSDAVAVANSWPENDVRRELLAATWDKLAALTNTGRHPADLEPPFSYRDARMCLHLTAVLLEYIG